MSRGWMMITDTLPSIHTSCDVPAGAVFGPCDPQQASLGDSIAFIALRCSDRCTTAYAHQVDTSIPTVSGEGPVWLRLVRSARNAEEQNLEAYVKDGRLFYRALKNISRKAELLVWYGEDLTELLGLTCYQKTNKGYRCSYCRQNFLFEFPLLAHQRFLCSERSMRINSKSRVQNKPLMDFHHLAKNQEICTHPLRDSITRRRHSVESEEEESDQNPFSGARDCSPLMRVRAAVKRKLSSSSSEICMANEGGHSSQWATLCHANLNDNPVFKTTGPQKVANVGLSQLSTTVSDQEKSAFIQPPRSTSQISNLALALRFNSGLSFSGNRTTFPSMTSALATKPQTSALFKQQALVYESRLWSKNPKTPQARISPESSLLPAALSPLGLPAQNWCAKCSISFHMTSDLVQHMRSHHKRSTEQKIKNSEKWLRCPICEEGFRERHHLSRHMSSHM